MKEENGKHIDVKPDDAGRDDVFVTALLEANRRLRHDFMNYLQVISGYLQIGDMEKAVRYVKKSSDALRNYDPVSGLRLPLVQAVLFHFMTHWNKERRCLEVTADGDFSGRCGNERDLAALLMDILGSLEEYISCGDSCRVKLITRDAFCVQETAAGFLASSGAESLPGFKTIKKRASAAGLGLRLEREQGAIVLTVHI